MTEQTERKNLWLEVERITAQWSDSLGISHPPFPLERLRPLWNSNHRLMENDHQKLEALERENLRLKFELAQIKHQFEQSSNGYAGNINRRRVNRRLST